MAAIDIRAELKSLIDNESDLSFLQALKILLVHQRADWWDEISAKEKAEIQEGVEQANKGEFITHNEVMNNPQKWR